MEEWRTQLTSTAHDAIGVDVDGMAAAYRWLQLPKMSVDLKVTQSSTDESVEINSQSNSSPDNDDTFPCRQTYRKINDFFSEDKL